MSDEITAGQNRPISAEGKAEWVDLIYKIKHAMESLRDSFKVPLDLQATREKEALDSSEDRAKSKPATCVNDRYLNTFDPDCHRRMTVEKVHHDHHGSPKDKEPSIADFRAQMQKIMQSWGIEPENIQSVVSDSKKEDSKVKEEKKEAVSAVNEKDEGQKNDEEYNISKLNCHRSMVNSPEPLTKSLQLEDSKESAVCRFN